MSTIRTTRHLHPFPAVLLATASVALLGLLAANMSISTAVRSRESNPPATASHVVAQAATMQIIPAAVIDHSAPHFIGTGDGSAGFWTP